VAPPSLCPLPPPPASATPLMYVWMSKEFSCLWMLGTSTKPLWSRGMISASQARGPGFDPPLRKVFQLSDFYFCWGWDWHRSRWSNLLFPSREENRAVRKTALFPSQLWGKYSPHSIKDSVGNEIWCDQTCRCCWTMSGKIKKIFKSIKENKGKFSQYNQFLIKNPIVLSYRLRSVNFKRAFRFFKFSQKTNEKFLSQCTAVG